MNERQSLTPNQIRDANARREREEMRRMISSLLPGGDDIFEDDDYENMQSRRDQWRPTPGKRIEDWHDYRPPMTEDELDARKRFTDPKWRTLGIAMQGVNNAGLNPYRYIKKFRDWKDGKPQEDNDQVMVPQNAFEEALLNGTRDGYDALMLGGTAGLAGVAKALSAGANAASKWVRWPSKAARYLATMDAVPTELGAAYGMNAALSYADTKTPDGDAGWGEKASYLAKLAGLGVAGGLGGAGAVAGVRSAGKNLKDVFSHIDSYNKNMLPGSEMQPAFAAVDNGYSPARSSFDASVETPVFFNQAENSRIIMPGEFEFDPTKSVDEQMSRILQRNEGKKSAESKELINQMPHNNLPEKEMRELERLNEALAEEDSKAIRNALENINKNPLDGDPFDVVVKMQFLDGHPDLTLHRGAVYKNRQGKLITSGEELERACGTSDNFGLIKLKHKHGLPDKQILDIFKKIRSNWMLEKINGKQGNGYLYVLPGLDQNPVVLVTREIKKGGNGGHMVVSGYMDENYPFRALSRNIYHPERDGRIFQKMAVYPDGHARPIMIGEHELVKFYNTKKMIEEEAKRQGIQIQPLYAPKRH